jgi:hypothetical protein
MEKMSIQIPKKKLKPYRDCHTTLNNVFSYEFTDHVPPSPPVQVLGVIKNRPKVELSFS